MAPGQVLPFMSSASMRCTEPAPPNSAEIFGEKIIVCKFVRYAEKVVSYHCLGLIPSSVENSAAKTSGF